MAKYRRRRRYYRSKGRWSSNIQEINTTTVTSQGLGSNFYSMVLAYNPPQTNTSTSQIYTVKNLEVSFNVDEAPNVNTQAAEDVCVYLMYVPQGMNVTINYVAEHPEYIMNYKFIGSPSVDTPSSQAQPTKVRSRLSRRLNTGDYLMLFIKYTDTRSSNTSPGAGFNLHGIARWWTKAN